MRWLSPKVLFDKVRQFLGKIDGVMDILQIWRRPKILAAVIGGVLLVGSLVVLILPSPDKVPTAGANVNKANAGGKAKKIKKAEKKKTTAQMKAEAAAERKIRAELLADTKRIMAVFAKKEAAAKERQRQADLERKLKWISRGNGRLWKVTRLGFEGKPKKEEKAATEPKQKSPEIDLFATNAFPLGADEEDGTYTIGDDPEMDTASMENGSAPGDDKKALPGKDWRKYIWEKQNKGKKAKKKAKRQPEIIPASYIYATFDSSESDLLALPPIVDRVFRHSRRLVIGEDYSTDAIDAWSKATPVEDFVSLTAIVRGKLFGAVERAGVRYRLSSGTLDNMKPWAVVETLSIEPAESLRLRVGRHTLPEALQIRAQARGMATVALESIEQTIQRHSDFTDEEQVKLLAMAVRMNRRVETYRADMKEAYLAGETVRMSELHRKWLSGFGPVLAANIQARMVHSRSRLMAKNLVKQLNRGKSFVAIPAINMPGRKGVLRRLTRKGYRVRYVETDSKKPILVANPKYVRSPFFGDTLDPTPRKKKTPQIATKPKKKPKVGSKAKAKPMAKPKAKPMAESMGNLLDKLMGKPKDKPVDKSMAKPTPNRKPKQEQEATSNPE
jgi:uncharacterized protein YbaP (TraB family)